MMYEPRLPSPMCSSTLWEITLLAPVANKMSFRLTVDYELDDTSIEQTTSSNSMIFEVNIFWYEWWRGVTVCSETKLPCFILQVSRLHNIAEVCASIYTTLQSQLRHTEDMYALYWPDRKVLVYNRILV